MDPFYSVDTMREELIGMGESKEKPGEPRPPTEDAGPKPSPWMMWEEKHCKSCSFKRGCSHTREVACVLAEILNLVRMRPIK